MGKEGRRPHFKVQPRAQASSPARWAAGLSPAAARTRSVLQAAPLPSAASGFHLLPVSLRPGALKASRRHRRTQSCGLISTRGRSLNGLWYLSYVYGLFFSIF